VILAAMWLACAHRDVLQAGTASWYGAELRGRPTASGEPFRPGRRTCAHPTLPFGTVLRVERTDTGAHVRVVVNDRGPFVKGRIVDLSARAAAKLDLKERGLGPVELVVVGCKERYEGRRSCGAASAR
jgi:rare lipoprotein A